MDSYIERIKQVYPDLSIRKCTRNNDGQNNDVFIINDALVFRFPKYGDGISGMQEETKILQYIRNRVSLLTPNPIYQSFESLEAGCVFIGYPLIQGSPLWREALDQINDQHLVQGLASQLAAFLSELHSISTDAEGALLRLADNNPREEMSQLLHKIQLKLFPYMRKEAQREISRTFESFLNSESCSAAKTTLIHGDFGDSNIIWDPVACKVSGIIDFGGSGWGDPAYDLAGLLSSYGEDFFTLCISMYPNGTEIAERAKFYKSTFALLEALHGIENNDIHAFESGIKDYR